MSPIPGFPVLPTPSQMKSLTQTFPEQEVKTEVTFIPGSSTMGFISEAANLVLLRVMAWRQTVPSNARFLALDTEGKLCYSTYVRGLPGWGTWPWRKPRGAQRSPKQGKRQLQVWKSWWAGALPVGLPRAGESKSSCVRRSRRGRWHDKEEPKRGAVEKQCFLPRSQSRKNKHSRGLLLKEVFF